MSSSGRPTSPTSSSTPARRRDERHALPRGDHGDLGRRSDRLDRHPRTARLARRPAPRPAMSALIWDVLTVGFWVIVWGSFIFAILGLAGGVVETVQHYRNRGQR